MAGGAPAGRRQGEAHGLRIVTIRTGSPPGLPSLTERRQSRQIRKSDQIGRGGRSEKREIGRVGVVVGSVVSVVVEVVVLVVGGTVVVVVVVEVVVLVVGGTVVVVVVGGGLGLVVVVVGASVVVVVAGGLVVVVVVGNGSGSGNSWIGVPEVVVVVELPEGLVEMTLGWVVTFVGLVVVEVVECEAAVVGDVSDLVKTTIFGVVVVGPAAGAAVVAVVEGVPELTRLVVGGCVATVVVGTAAVRDG
jgi:hypothetical protein